VPLQKRVGFGFVLGQLNGVGKLLLSFSIDASLLVVDDHLVERLPKVRDFVGAFGYQSLVAFTSGNASSEARVLKQPRHDVSDQDSCDSQAQQETGKTDKHEMLTSSLEHFNCPRSS
jgi:hypothetical protein